MKILVSSLSLWATLLLSVPVHAAVVSVDETAFAGVGPVFGSNVGVNVPITLRRGGQQIEATNLIVSADDLAFFGFEDPQGIDQIDFGTELNSSFVSQLDNLRFERDPTGAVSLAGPAGFSDTEAVLDFEQFVPNSDVVSGQFSGLGAIFDSMGGGWPVEPHDDYGPDFAAAALDAGAGSQGLFHMNDQEEILFDPPVRRVGFQFGSNVDVRPGRPSSCSRSAGARASWAEADAGSVSRPGWTRPPGRGS